MTINRFIHFVLLISVLTSCKRDSPEADESLLAIFLTWESDPTSTMTIDWHVFKERSFYYREKGSGDWEEAEGKVHPFPHSDRVIQRVRLEGLQPETSYEIRFGESSATYYFNTMPLSTENRPVKIVLGGDTMHYKDVFERINRQVNAYEPDFVVFGGDLAYADGLPENVHRWYDWFDVVKRSLITSDNRIIPIVVAIGNHEVLKGGFDQHTAYHPTDRNRARIASFFYNFFAFPGQPGYNVLDFGNYLSLFVLDSDHTNPVEGEQSLWLKDQLAAREHMLFKIPVYHVAAFPSARSFDGKTQQSIRKHWVPLFEEHGVKIAFENHDHAYKRTNKIRNNQVDETGIVYIGDGAWGVNTRNTHNVANTWYLKAAATVRHFIIMTLEGNHYEVEVVDEGGTVIDRLQDSL